MTTVDKTTGTPPMIGKVLSQVEWRRYCETYDFGKIWPDKVVVHHTYIPNQTNWNGLTSMKGMQTYYHDKGWTAAPHIYSAGDGIWLFTPMSQVGIHAQWCNATRDAQGHLTGYSIGVEIVWDGSKSQPTGVTWQNTLWVLGELCDRLGKTPRELITFHRYCGKAACPGAFITDEWVYTEVESWLAQQHGVCVAPYYVGPNGAWIRQGPSNEFPQVRFLNPGEPILADTHPEGWIHMYRFPPLQYDEGFVEQVNLVRA